MPRLGRTHRPPASIGADELQRSADRLRTEMVGSLLDAGERLWQRVAVPAEPAQPPQRTLDTYAAALNEAVAARASDLLAGEVVRLRRQTQARLAIHAREIVELARLARAAEAERAERFEQELAEIERRSQPRPLDIPRPKGNDTKLNWR